MKKTFAIALVMMLLAASFSFAENFEKENALPAIPSEPTNEGLSQDEAVGIVKQKMAHNGVKQEFIDYVLPLIQGEPKLPKEDSLPRFAKLKKVLAK